MEKKKKVSTKQKIINEAIRLYNEQGAQNITSRHIAAELGISHGNLDYHYKNREAILLEVYKQMRQEMSAAYQGSQGEGTSFERFHQLLLNLDQFQGKYRFFNLDVLEICRSNPEVSKVLNETLELRKEQMRSFFKRFVEEGLVSDELDTSFNRLQHSIRIIITFWLSQQEVLSNFQFKEPGEMGHCSSALWGQ
ncbi:TetR/AcrR family transcriptional regulator, partial [Echinicola sediminis]